MEDKNNVYCKFTYKCGVCGKEHPNVLDRAKCEIACTEKAEKEAKKAAELKKKQEQKARKAEVDSALENLHKLISAYIKDYGHYMNMVTVEKIQTSIGLAELGIVYLSNM